MKKKKIFICVALTMLFLLCLLAFLFVNLGKNSEGAKEYEKQIKEESAQITETLISEVDLVTQETKDEQGANTGDNLTNSSVTDNDSERNQLTGEEKKSQLKKILKVKYHDILLEQKAEAINMVNNLVAQGKADYLSLKESGGWNATAKAALMSDYMARVGTMEAEMDASFASLLQRMEENLVAEGIEAAPIIDDFNAEYSTIKEDTRSAFMDKLLS